MMPAKGSQTESSSRVAHQANSQSDLLRSVAQSTSYNIALQFVFRLLTFVLNAVVLRYVTKDLLGVVNVRLALLYSTILFIGREAFRKACLSKSQQQPSWEQVINITWCSPLCGLLCAPVFAYIWLYHLELPDPSTVPHYRTGVLVYATAAVLEMTCEPLFISAQLMLFVRFKVLVEAVALLVKCTVTISLIYFYPSWGLLAFCAAQISFSLAYIAGYIGYFSYLTRSHPSAEKTFPFSSLRAFLPRVPVEGPIISVQMARLTWSFLKQSFLKQLLTEGERYMMTVFNMLTFADQGVFDIVSNLGSLVARFIFQPLEESSYLLFSQTITRGLPAIRQTKEAALMSAQVLCHLLKSVLIIGLTILVFGFSYAELALYLYGGSALGTGTGPYLLRWYCVYVLVLAVNGITECFSFATMSQELVDRYNYKMLGFSVCFLLTSVLFTRQFGSAGFILANCCNMMARIVHSVYVINQFYKATEHTPLQRSRPDVRTLCLYGVVFCVTAYSEGYLDLSVPVTMVPHILTGALCLLITLGCLLTFEKDTVHYIKERFVLPVIKGKSD